jgi:uncharacterized protein YggE
MKTKAFMAIGIMLALVLFATTGCGTVGTAATDLQPLSVNMNSQQTGIWVSGQGKVTVVPDIATITLGVSSQSATVADAQSKAANAMDKVMSALTANGVNNKDIRTQYFNIQQVTRWDDKTQQQIIIGYSVSNMVIAKIRAMDTVGTTIDAVALAGGDLTRINGIDFTVEQPDNYYSQARELAMNDAKTKANQIAGLAGVTLGKPTYVSESTYMPPTVPVYAKGAAADSVVTTPISPGETDITLNVQVVYTIP